MMFGVRQLSKVLMKAPFEVFVRASMDSRKICRTLLIENPRHLLPECRMSVNDRNDRPESPTGLHLASFHLRICFAVPVQLLHVAIAASRPAEGRNG